MLNACTTTGNAIAPQGFSDLVSGRRRGLMAALLRCGLWVLSLGYGVGVRLHNFAFARGWRRISRASVPVISVGNLTVGGTGKTPCVEYVASYFNDRDCRVCILSRGYKAGASGDNDESLVLAENLPDVPHLQGVDRAAFATIAVEELESEILVLDDGFQHRRLARDLDLVLIDATRPWGYGHLLPRGLLREPVSSLRRAHAVIITRRDQVAAEELTSIRRCIERHAPAVPIIECVHRPLALVNADERKRDPSSLNNAPIAAFSGIGNHEAFAQTLMSLKCQILGTRNYPDHHHYSRSDVESLETWAKSFPEETAILTTQKDLVKLRLSELGGRPLWALRIGLAFSDEAALHRLFAQVLFGMDRGSEEVKFA